MAALLGHTTTHTTLLSRLADSDDPLAWREFCERYGGLIRGFARRRHLQPADCDDVLQDVLLALSKAMPGFSYDPAKGKFRSYLKTAVDHVIYHRFRQRDRLVLLGENADACAAVAEEASASLWEEEWRQYHVRQAMRTIESEFRDSDRMAFESCFIGGCSARQVADSFGLTVNQVYHATSRISQRLKQVIRAQVEEEG